MPDISMCGNSKCPKRMKCYRHRAIPSPMLQTYFLPDEWWLETAKSGKCEHFMKISAGDRIRTEEELEELKRKAGNEAKNHAERFRYF